MAMLQLPRTEGCLVCGRDNPVGLRLTSFVDDATGVVSTTYTASPHHIGFTGVLHGGILATVLDEIMVWTATWHGKRFCLAAELTVRFRSPGRVEVPMTVQGRIDVARSRLITTTGVVRAGDTLIAEGTAKYIPLPDAENAAFVATLVHDAESEPARKALSPLPPGER